MSDARTEDAAAEMEEVFADLEDRSGEAEPIIGQRRTVPTPGVVITSAARRIIELSKGGEKLESLVVTGNKEPTSHPELIEIVENLRELRNKWFAKAALCLVSENLDRNGLGLLLALAGLGESRQGISHQLQSPFLGLSLGVEELRERSVEVASPIRQRPRVTQAS